MATMVKEKRREKKKSKDKSVKHSALQLESKELEESNVPRSISYNEVVNTSVSLDNIEKTDHELSSHNDEKKIDTINTENQCKVDIKDTQETESKTDSYTEANTHTIKTGQTKNNEIPQPPTEIPKLEYSQSFETNEYKYLNSKLANMCLTSEGLPVSEARQLEMENEKAYLANVNKQTLEEDSIPSAPIIEEQLPNAPTQEYMKVTHEKPRIRCMPLEQAVKVFGENEMTNVWAMSEREEAIVEAGPASSADHPLVDLLTTFRSSLMALEREKINISKTYADEEKFRSSLWKVEKRNIYMKEECKCGSNVELKATYDYAELMRDKLPIARLKLEGLLKDVQESYCHYQHAALLAHFQIEQLIYETINKNKMEIREALSLVLHALRSCDGAPDVLPKALQRWAYFLADALVDCRDLRNLLFLIHHLFRQSRSVMWASRVIKLPMVDRIDAVRAIAILRIFLDNTKLDSAQECTEDVSEGWEEVSLRGGGAVSEGCLRERDLLALVDAMPLRAIVARILLIYNADVREASPEYWQDDTGGVEVMRACCGVRSLLAVANTARRNYAALRARLLDIAEIMLRGLAALSTNNRIPYKSNLKDSITAELEACFAAGFTFFGIQNLHRVPASLLSYDTAKEYCFTYIIGLHDNIEKCVESLDLKIPSMSCAMRVRIVAEAAISRLHDHELARIVLDFLLQVGVKRKSETCKGGCEATAREHIEKLIDAHPYLHSVALHIVADLSQVESLDPTCVTALCLHKWRPNSSEALAVLNDWKVRCEALIYNLLTAMDFTPYTGVSLECQRVISWWLCEWGAVGGEGAWTCARGLRVGAALWGDAGGGAPPHSPATLHEKAHALRATHCGDTVPVICTEGLNYLLDLAKERPRDAVHCLAPVMLAMATSAESILHTPKFVEVLECICNGGRSLMQRALGRGGDCGLDLLHRLVYAQVTDQKSFGPRVTSSWCAALLPVAACAPALETAAIVSRDFGTLDINVTYYLQELPSVDLVTLYSGLSHTAPLVTECVLRVRYSLKELQTELLARLNVELARQRDNKQKIHVDNALKKIGASISSEELVVYKCANAALIAPLDHPSHLLLWRLFMEIYLLRPPEKFTENEPPVGVYFFSGIVKSRVLNRIKARLQESIAYHTNEADALITKINKSIDENTSNKVVKSESIVIDKNLLPALSISDLTSDSSGFDESDGEEAEVLDRNDSIADPIALQHQYDTRMLDYHQCAKKMLSEYLAWIERGDKTRAMPFQADIGKFISADALSEAWRRLEHRISVKLNGDPDEYPRMRPPPPPRPQTPTHTQTALNSINTIRDNSQRRTKSKLCSPLEDIDFNDSRGLYSIIDKYLREIEDMASEWCADVSHVSRLDKQVCELVGSLRVPRPLPPVARHCHNHCKQIVFHITEREWCISTSSERGIKENRALALKCIRKLSRARPHTARTVAALHTIARGVRSLEQCVRSLQRAWGSAARSQHCNLAADALTAFFQQLAQRWVVSKGDLCATLLGDWLHTECGPLQRALCGALVSPRDVQPAHWPQLYHAVLTAKLPPDIIFSYLSKFEMCRWCEVASEEQRAELLLTLIDAAVSFGPSPRASEGSVCELVCVHVRGVTSPATLRPLLLRGADRVSTSYWQHAAQATETHARHLTFDQLGHLLRELGDAWSKQGMDHASYAPHVARVLHALMRAFVAAAVAMTYEPERVGWYAWGALLESWTPWLTHCKHDDTTRAFVDCILHIITDCPGSECVVLQKSFECVLCMRAEGSLRHELLRLPWHQAQWFYGPALLVAQMTPSLPAEFATWQAIVTSHTTSDTLLRGVTDDALPTQLAHLLQLFAATPVRFNTKLLDETKSLPWHRLPEPALAEVLDRFFAVNNDPTTAYHDMQHFRVLLFASELSPPVREAPCSVSKRLRLVSTWSCAGAAHANTAQHAPHATAVLHHIHHVAPFLDMDEVTQLYSRAMVIMCYEPAGTAALQVWCEWLRASTTRGACVACVARGAGALTAAAHAHTLADTALKELLQRTEYSWESMLSCWRESPWRCEMFARRGALHAAYLSAHAHTRTLHAHPTLRAVHAHKHNFVENEVIIALWICYATRVALDCLALSVATGAVDSTAIDVAASIGATATSDSTAKTATIDSTTTTATATNDSTTKPATADSSAAEETLHAARSLLTNWGQQPRRSILSVVTLKTDTGSSTPKHRILCRLALCLLNPSPENIREYESACGALPTAPLQVSGGGAPALSVLHRGVTRLYPNHDKYFTIEKSYSTH